MIIHVLHCSHCHSTDSRINSFETPSNHALLGVAVGTEHESVWNITRSHEAPTRDESCLYLVELLPVCERKGDVYVTRCTPRVEIKDVSQEYVTSHGPYKEIGEV